LRAAIEFLRRPFVQGHRDQTRALHAGRRSVTAFPSTPAPILAIVLIAIALFTATAEATPAEAARAFNVPAGEAERALRQFSEQADLDLLYSIAAVRGEFTRAVEGNLTPSEALGQLLRDTPLRAARHPVTGGYAITRESGTVREKTPSPSSGDMPPTSAMKLPRPFALLTAWLALTFSPSERVHAADARPDSNAGVGTIEGRVQNAVTGRYISNARVSIAQTDLMTFTDESGRFRLAQVPSGPVTLEVFFTGLEPQRVSLTLPGGGSVTRDVSLASLTTPGQQDTVQLDPFQVMASKDTDAESIAINEQRFAPNIKNVATTDAYGDVVGGNSISDFLKYMPGIQVSGEQFESESIFVRGFPANFTAISADGAMMATSQVSGNRREFNLVLSINNYSRVEVTKVPTPSTAADTMAGSVNMISKNSFERSRAEFRYQVNMTGNLNHLTLEKEPFITETRKYRINPGLSFDYTLPVSERLGFVLTGSHSNTFFNRLVDPRTYRTSGAGTGASTAAPFFGQWQLTDAPQYRYRSSLGGRTDWRVTRHSTLSVGFMTNFNRMVWGDSNVTINAGTNGSPSIAGGVPLSYRDTYTIGATGRGSFQYNQTHWNRTQVNSVGNFRYRLDDGDWMVNVTGSVSRARAWFRNAERGAFAGVTAATKFPVRVEFLDIDPSTGRPGRVRVLNNNNQEIDPYDPANFNLTAARIEPPANIRVSLDTWSGDIKRRLGFLRFPASLQVGGSVRTEARDLPDMAAKVFTYQGPNGDQSSAPYVAQVYEVQRKPFNFGNTSRRIPQLSPHTAFRAWQQNPALFTMTPAQLVTEEINRRTLSEYVDERVEALYLQPEARLFSGRLNILTGMRYEKTSTGGKGLLQDVNAVYVRNPDGSFARNASGARIRKPEAGAVGSMQEVRLIYTERGYVANRSYDGYYPSLHLTYNATDKFLVRAAYARTYGRPNFTDIIPRAVVNEGDFEEEPDPGVALGTITIRNTALRPWTADNYDASVEYYTSRGGLFGASVFHKRIQDFFGVFAKMATAEDLRTLELDDQYLGWQVNSTYNLATRASVSGLELSANQTLHGLGNWGQYFKAFANFTKLKLKGDRDANFSGFLPLSANWGLTFTRKKVMIGAKWNYRGKQDRGPFADFGPDAREYWPSRTTCDVNFSYSLRPNLSLFFNARDVLDRMTYRTYREGSQTPDYARLYNVREFGTPFSVGVKGSF
jgi:TonB-dependent receptor